MVSLTGEYRGWMSSVMYRIWRYPESIWNHFVRQIGLFCLLPYLMEAHNRKAFLNLPFDSNLSALEELQLVNLINNSTFSDVYLLLFLVRYVRNTHTWTTFLLHRVVSLDEHLLWVRSSCFYSKQTILTGLAMNSIDAKPILHTAKLVIIFL